MRTDLSSCNPDEWVKPEDIQAWQSLIYRKKYNAGSESYRLHYGAAVRRVNPSSISVARMEWSVNAFALARIRGELPTPK